MGKSRGGDGCNAGTSNFFLLSIGLEDACFLVSVGRTILDPVFSFKSTPCLELLKYLVSFCNFEFEGG